MIDPVIQKIGENIQLGEVTELSGANIGSYIHNGKSGVLVALTAGDEILGKDVAMHIAAMKPEYLATTDVPEEKKNVAKELFQKEVDESGKPEDIKQKMLEGKLSSYFKEQTLLEQPFIKNPDMTIGKLVAGSGASVTAFIRQTI